MFLLASVDGKISTGATDNMDFDKDIPKLKGAAEGLFQYYEIEGTTDLWSFNSGRVQEKMGVNEKPMPKKSPVSFVLADNTHLTEHGVRYFSALSDKFVLITSNKHHPAFSVKEENVYIIYQEEPSLTEAFEKLKTQHGCERITLQSGGTLNSLLLREGLIDYVDIVIAPILVGGRNTSTVIDGESLTLEEELSKIGILELIECVPLKDSYVRLCYKVMK